MSAWNLQVFIRGDSIDNVTEVYTIIFLPHSEASSHELLSLRGTFRLTLNLSAPFDECYGLKGRRNSCCCIIAAEGLQYQIKLNFLATVAGNRHLSTYKKRIQFPFYFFPRMPIWGTFALRKEIICDFFNVAFYFLERSGTCTAYIWQNRLLLVSTNIALFTPLGKCFLCCLNELPFNDKKGSPTMVGVFTRRCFPS